MLGWGGVDMGHVGSLASLKQPESFGEAEFYPTWLGISDVSEE